MYRDWVRCEAGAEARRFCDTSFTTLKHGASTEKRLSVAGYQLSGKSKDPPGQNQAGWGTLMRNSRYGELRGGPPATRLTFSEVLSFQT